jgi:hypothetical protein
LLFFIILAALILYFIQRARGGRIPSLRRLPALDRIDEAIGRAVEMNRPVHLTLGAKARLHDQYSPFIYAGLACLEYVSRAVARNKADLYVTCYRGDTIPLQDEIMRNAYIAEGNPDGYKGAAETLIYLSGSTDTGNIATAGLFRRWHPAANIMIGGYGSESLVISEAGALEGALQIGGTGIEITSMGYIAALCDYVIIADEVLATGAYLSKDPLQTGSLAGQDWGKYIGVVVFIIGVIAFALGSTAIADFLGM